MRRLNISKRLSRLVTGLVMAGTLASFLPVGTDTEPPRQPNVLFIIADDLRPELNCYGQKHMVTPHIDRLAGQGVLFRRAYCQQAVCAPSRASFLTGLRPATTGIFDLNHPMRRQLPNVVSLPQLFQQHGYQTLSFGKVYHHDEDDAEYWSRRSPGEWPSYADPVNRQRIRELLAEGRSRGLTGAELSRSARPAATERAEIPDDGYSDGRVAQEVVQFLKNPGKAPFLVCMGFRLPHLPFTAPQKYWDLYPASTIQLPVNRVPADVPDIALTNWGELRAYGDMPKEGPVNPEQARRLIQGYRAAVSYVDALIGNLLKTLDETGLARNTVVVLIGDHGWKLGDAGMWCKHTNFELDTPLLIRAPQARRGMVTDALVEFVDIMPTLADLCGLPAPQAIEGVSLRPLLTDGQTPWKKAVFSQYPRGKDVMGYSVRDSDFRYTEWRRPDRTVVARELYDHRGNSRIGPNLAGDAAYREVVSRMQTLLDGGWQAALPIQKRP